MRSSAAQVRSTLIEEADDLARTALQRATEQADNAVVQLEAARALSVAADRRMLAGMLGLIEEEGPFPIAELLVLDEQLPRALKKQVQGLATESLARARLARELNPDDHRADYLDALSLGMVAWAEGTSTALLRGRGPGLDKGTKRIVELDPEFDEAGPLRLRGRFLDLAPWPYGDEDEAIELLERAQRLAPLAISEWFLGDVYYRAGRRDEAREAWARGIEADGDASSGAGVLLQRALCEARLSATEPRPASIKLALLTFLGVTREPLWVFRLHSGAPRSGVGSSGVQ